MKQTVFSSSYAHLTNTCMHNRDQYQKSIERSVRLGKRGVKNAHPSLDFSEWFTLKDIYVKYKNAILTHIDCFCLTYGHVFSQIFNWLDIDYVFRRSN